ncbi:WYL domain-containing protein [Hymenobacter saemangeumensis]
MTSYTKRTFQRDVLVLAEDFCINVSYDQKQRGYVVTSTDPLPAGHQRLLEALELQAFLRLPAALAPHVQLEVRQPLGLEHLRPLLYAVQARQLVAFSYCKFWEDQPTRRLVGPLLLKEFKGRWYLLATKPETGELRCFGLDRITDLEQSPHSFTHPITFDASAYYAEAFGIIRPDDELPQQVVLSLSPTQARYVQTYPLHASQQVLSQSGTETRIELQVFDTHDFRMELLSMGEEVQVIAPAGLRKWMSRTCKAVAGFY